VGITMQVSSVGHAPATPTVLLVEDEVLIRLMIAEVLRDRGMQVLEASSAEEALTVLESALPVHLLFTDIHLPGAMNGVALANLAHERYPHLKLIITSSQPPVGDSGAVADTFIPKPYDLPAVIERVEALLTQFSDGA
jgi:CheY-like chemotaxis protein